MNIGIIGAGKVGFSLGKYLSEAKKSVVGYYSRSPEHALEAGNFTNTESYDHLEDLISRSDTLFITTSDGAIKEVWDCIRNYELKGKIICHFSGSLSSNIFSNWDETGASVCSLHPMYAFSDKYSSYKNLKSAYMVLEGDERAKSELAGLFGNLGNRILSLDSDDKIKYHAAASLASNFVVGLCEMSLNLLEECGFSRKTSLELLKPIAETNINSIFKKDTSEALTGSIERNDMGTVEKHLSGLDGDYREIYKALAMVLCDISERKNVQVDYGPMRELLTQSE